jgi:hypothetical protein
MIAFSAFKWRMHMRSTRCEMPFRRTVAWAAGTFCYSGGRRLWDNSLVQKALSRYRGYNFVSRPLVNYI